MADGQTPRRRLLVSCPHRRQSENSPCTTSSLLSSNQPDTTPVTMPYNEDAQPNEVRHARKGNTVVPTIRPTTQPRVGPQGHRGRGFDSRAVPHRFRGSAPRGGPSRATGGSTLRGNNRDRGGHRGHNRGSARGRTGTRDPTRYDQAPQTSSRRENGDTSDYDARRPAKKSRLEHPRLDHRDTVRDFGIFSNNVYGRKVDFVGSPKVASLLPCHASH